MHEIFMLTHEEKSLEDDMQIASLVKSATRLTPNIDVSLVQGVNFDMYGRKLRKH